MPTRSRLTPKNPYLNLDSTSLYAGNFVWISSNLGVRYWKSVIVLDVFLKYFQHYCISVSTPLNDTGRQYRRTTPVEFFLSTTSNLLDNRHTMNWILACLPSLPQVTRTPHLDFTSLDRKMLHLHLKNSSRPSLVFLYGQRTLSVTIDWMLPFCYVYNI